MSPREGAFLGRYELLVRIASGGMGTVWAARARGAGGFERLVAVKLLHPHLAEEEEFIAMLLDEARLAARIHHKNVVATLDVEESELGYAIVMEHVECLHLGGLLRRVTRQGRPLAPAITLRIALDALAGLGAAHALVDEDGTALGLVHRDVSPQNVLVGADGIARLIDFGVAKAHARMSATRDGRLKGKLAYMAPEQALGEEVDRRSDLFSMGVVLWEGLTGRRLFSGEDDLTVFSRVQRAQVPPLASFEPTLAALDPVLARALERDRERRFGTAESFAAALERAAEGTTGIATAADVARAMERHCGDELSSRRARLRAVMSGASGPGRTVSDELTRPSIPRRRLDPTPSASSDPAVPPPLPATVTPPPARAGWVLALLLLAATTLGGAGVYLALSRVAPAPTATVAIAADPDAAPRLAGPVVATAPLGAGLLPTVRLTVSVLADGRVASAEVVRPRDDLAEFEALAIAHALGLHFEPAVAAGVAVPATTEISVGFAAPPVLTGFLRIRGSDTLGGAYLPDLARRFGDDAPGVHVDVEALGSSTAFAGLFDGSADLGASSRPAHADELHEAAALGISLREIVLGYDAIAIVVHPDDPLPSLSLAELAEIFTGARTDLGPLGGLAGPPRLAVRAATSGTCAFFVERALGDRTLAPADAFEHSDDLVRYVASEPHAIGFVSAGAVTPAVRVVPLRADDGRLWRPTPEDAAASLYPLARPLSLYAREHPGAAARAFLEFALGEESRVLFERHGFAWAGTDPSVLSSMTGEADPVVVPMRFLFSPDAPVLDTLERARLDGAVVDVSARARVIVSGHADASETEPSALAMARADGVAAVIRAAAPLLDVVVDAHGAARPVGSPTTDAGRRLNRRVDVFVVEPR